MAASGIHRSTYSTKSLTYRGKKNLQYLERMRVTILTLNHQSTNREEHHAACHWDPSEDTSAMDLSKTLKVTIIGSDNQRDHLVQYDVHRYTRRDHEHLLERILGCTGQRNFDCLRLYWKDSEQDWISITTYRDLKNYLNGCAGVNRQCEIFVRRLEKRKIIWQAIRRAVHRYGKVYFKWI